MKHTLKKRKTGRFAAALVMLSIASVLVIQPSVQAEPPADRQQTKEPSPGELQEQIRDAKALAKLSEGSEIEVPQLAMNVLKLNPEPDPIFEKVAKDSHLLNEAVAADLVLRAQLGLSAERTMIVDLYLTPSKTTGNRDLGFVLTPTEAAEMAVRSSLEDDAIILEDQFSHDPSFGGTYIDHKGGGRLVLLSTEPARPEVAAKARSVVKRPDRLDVRSAESSFAALTRLSGLLAAHTRGSIQGVSVDTVSNRVEVSLLEGAPDIETAKIGVLNAAGLDRHMIEFRVRPKFAAEQAGEDPNAPPIKAGHGITIQTPTGSYAGDCSAGGEVRRSNFTHTSWLITAGHCFTEHGLGSGARVAYNGTHIGVVRDIIYSGSVDIALVELISHETALPRVLTAFPSSRPVIGTQYGQTVGAIRCAFGRRSPLMRCGTITSNNASQGSLTNLVQVQNTTCLLPGDSGASWMRVSLPDGTNISNPYEATAQIRMAGIHHGGPAGGTNCVEYYTNVSNFPGYLNTTYEESETTSIGVYAPQAATFFLRATMGGPEVVEFATTYGDPYWTPVAGDWNSDTTQSIGAVRVSNGQLVWLTTDLNYSNWANRTFYWGVPGDIPIVGDWDGDGIETPGVYRPWTAQFWLYNRPGASYVFTFGDPYWKPVVGDWNGDGVDTIGVMAGNTWFLRNINTTGYGDISFTFGDPSHSPVAGDWDHDGDDTPGIYAPASAYFITKNAIGSGFGDSAVVFGNPYWKPIVGDWSG